MAGQPGREFQPVAGGSDSAPIQRHDAPVQSDAMMTPPMNTGFVTDDPANFAKGITFPGCTGSIAVPPGTYSADKAIDCRDATSGIPMHPPVPITVAPGSAQSICDHVGMGSEATTLKHITIPELAAAVPSRWPAPSTGGRGMGLWPPEPTLALALGTRAAWAVWPRRGA